MTRRWTFALAIVAAALTGVWVKAQMTDDRPVPTLLPPGASLYLEAKDFGHLLDEWNRSGEKKRWLGSKNFEELSVSRLIQRLGQAGDEFSDVAGVPVSLTSTGQVAGGRSGFAFYNFSDVSFVYMTQISQTRMETSDLWRKRVDFQSREAAGTRFYVKADAKTGRKVAFASARGWFVLATNEDRMAETLLLISGGQAPSLASEGWFSAAAKQRTEAGDLRLICNMPALLASPQYRTYWIHRNASELKGIGAVVSDLFERADGFAEERVLIREGEPQPAVPPSSLAEATAYTPAGGSALLRGWSSPDRAQLGNVLRQVLWGEKAGVQVRSEEPAPEVSLEAGVTGTEADLETRIDEAPFERASEHSMSPLIAALQTMEPMALSHVQVTRVLRDQVFVLPQSGAVLYCRKPDSAALNAALAQVTGVLQTGNLDPLQVSVQGQAIVLTRVPLQTGASTVQVSKDATYLAVYDHRAEWPRYKQLFTILDQTAGSTEPGVSQQTPSFFSGNVLSLGESLSRLQRASIVSSDLGSTVRDSVRYEFAKP